MKITQNEEEVKVADEEEMKIERSYDNDARNNINEEESVSTERCLKYWLSPTGKVS